MSIPKPVLVSFEFDGFQDLPHAVDNVVASDSKTDANGNCWRLHLYPGGCRDSVEEGMIAVILINIGEEDVTCKFSFTIRNSLGYAVLTESDYAFHTFPSHGKEGFGYGYSDTKFMKRERILDGKNDILINGTSLHIDISIDVMPVKKELYHPPTPLVTNMLSLLESGEDSDVTFQVEGKTIKAHLPVLRANAPVLADLFRKQGQICQDSSLEVATDRLVSRRHTFSFGCDLPSDITCEPNFRSLVVNNMSIEVFHLVLQYVYGGHTPDNQIMLRIGKELIAAAHRFCIFELKMLAENTLVEGCVVNIKNVVEYFVFADTTDCALLKEYALSYLILHVEDVLFSNQTKKLQEAPELMSEVLVSVAKGDNKTQHSRIRMMSVSGMRKELARQEMDVNGSKEVLISRLEGSS